MTETSEAGKRERLHLRLDAAAKRRLERAAAYSHKSLSEFVLSRAVQTVDEIIQDRQSFYCGNEHAEAFYKKYGFLELPEVTRRLFIPLKTIMT